MYKKYKRKLIKATALFLAVNILLESTVPLYVYALTSGPSQPEVQSFEPIGATEMVDLFSGDFTYNIPLLEVPGPNGGYPLNLAYHGGIGMDEEASWVGLGWNLNPGAIVRQMRGLPDEFDGDIVKRTMDIKPDKTYSARLGAEREWWGRPKGSAGILSGTNTQALTGRFPISLGVSYNNYRGIGMSVGMSHSIASKNGLLGLNLNLNLDTQGGPSLGVSASVDAENGVGFKTGIGYDTRRGLSNLSISGGLNREQLKATPGRYEIVAGAIKKVEPTRMWVQGLSGEVGMTISLAGSSYSPGLGTPKKGISVNLSLKGGPVKMAGDFRGYYIKGNFTKEELKYRNKEQQVPSYGYLSLQNAGEDAALDFSRSNEGIVMRETQFMGMPQMNYDVYSVAGQGIAGMYRPFRSDIGAVYDPKETSKIAGGSLGGELGLGGSIHIGVDVSYNTSNSEGGAWKKGNGFASKHRFIKNNPANPLQEPAYFKVYGEKTSDDTTELALIGKDKAVKVALGGLGKTSPVLLDEHDKMLGAYSSEELAALSKEKREPRSTVVQQVSNKVLNNDGSVSGDYYVQYYDTDGQLKTFTRKGLRPDHHLAGFTTTSLDGVRYVYALPAYNNRQAECQFSYAGIQKTDVQSVVPVPYYYDNSGKKVRYKHDKTEEYYSRSEIPAYPHSFLLTSILGTDYVDADNIPGPSDGDLGYWVKFTYSKKSANFKWRAPFTGANFNKGLYNKLADDKASYLYGEKEIWYLQKIETKSHVSVLYTSPRKDGRGAWEELQNSSDPVTLGGVLYKLDSMRLFTKPEYQAKAEQAAPIMGVHFEYSYKLCRKVPNHAVDSLLKANPNIDPKAYYDQSGKLTLKKLYFTYQKSRRGTLTPYLFDYHEDNKAENPDYDTHAYDRWGNYKPYAPSNLMDHLLFPYTNQNDDYPHDLYAGAWSLKSVRLPSGAQIDVTYEADDYAYVQNKLAMQMTPIAGVGEVNNNTLTNKNFKVYFQLQRPIAVGTDPAKVAMEMRRYLDNSGQVYFKGYMTLKKPGSDSKEMVSGYIEVVPGSCALASQKTKDGKFYTHGYFEVKPLKTSNRQYHPFSAAAWQHMQQMQPEIIYNTNIEDNDVVSTIKSIGSMLGQVVELFRGYYGYAQDNKWGAEIDLSRAWVRLNSIDKKKYGGGVRVKQIALKDNWRSETGENSVYGQVYDYTTKDEEGNTISSGVAAYEPMIGGDEIALRIGKKYTDKLVLATGPTYTFEYPINEELYPGPHVGYTQVSVKSLASAVRAREILADGLNKYFPNANQEFGVTGMVVHEFYTAKEFPVVSSHTNISRQFSSPINFGLQGAMRKLGLNIQISRDHFTASQGYVTQLNDMHGKPKKVSYYPQDKDGKVLTAKPVSWMKYNYKSSLYAIENNQKVWLLNNEVDMLLEDKDGLTKKQKRLLGVDYEFFADSRYYNSNNILVGADGNVDIVPPPIPFVQLNFSYNTKRLDTYVINKVIHRSAILESVEAFDGSAIVETKNLLWDALTGEVLLSTVTNDFNAPIYSYNIPARFQYEKMGAAYQNTGLLFTSNLHYIPSTKEYSIDLEPGGEGATYARQLTEGDELLVRYNDSYTKMIVVRTDNNNCFLVTQSPQPIVFDPASYVMASFFVYRSGYRNLLMAKAGSITALLDPTNNANRKKDSCEVKFTVPIKCN